MDTNMKAPLCAKAVETVVKVYSGLRGSIFYSDRSSQCTSWLYRRTIQKTGLIQSMNNAQRALSWQFTLREHVNRNEGGAILYRLDSWKISVEQLKEMVWWYFYSNWNNHHNHRICSTNGRLPSMVKRTVLILFTATKRIKKTCVFCVNHYWILGGEGWKKRLQNAQPQKELLRSTGDWGVPQQAASGKVDSQKHRLLVQSYWWN